MNPLKLSFLSLIFLLAAESVAAQLGIRAGIAISDQHVDPDDNVKTSSLLGFSAGIVVEINTGNRFALQPELHFIQKAVYREEIFPVPGLQRNADFKENALMLAIMARYNVINFGESGSLYLGVSPFFSYGMDILVEGETLGISGVNSVDFSTKSRNLGWRRADYGVGGGIGLRFGNFVLDARYNYGLANIERHDDDLTINSRSILVGLCYYF